MKRKVKSKAQFDRECEEKSASDISFDSDCAAGGFSGIYTTAELHMQRVDNLLAIESYVEVCENLRNDLQKRKKMLLFSISAG